MLNVQQLGGGADNSASQLALDKTVSRSIAGFVTSNASNKEWPEAFTIATKEEFEGEYPSRLSLQARGLWWSVREWACVS